MERRRIAGPLLGAVAAALILPAPARAIFWNNDPAFGVTSSSGLTDRIHWFQNVHQIRNQTNGSLGTTTLLNNEWAITVRHVVQNGSNYGAIAPADQIYVDVGGRRYYADEIYTPDGGSEMALVRLRGGVAGAMDLTGSLNTSFDEGGRIVQIGGYGYRGTFNTTNAGGTNPGSVDGLGSFRRAYNIAYNNGGQVSVIADGEASLESYGFLEGTVGSGDSGGPMWGFYGSLRGGFDNPDDWRLIGLTATGSGGSGGESWWGQSNYTRVAAYSGFLQGTLGAADNAGAAQTEAWAVDSGSGFWDSGGDRISFTGSGDSSVAHAAFGEGGAGYTLDSVGDSLTLSLTLDTDQPLAATELRYGLFGDEGGTLDGVTSGGEPWNGYYATNAVLTRDQGVFEKGQGDGGTGAWWLSGRGNSAVEVPGSGTLATGTYEDDGLPQTPAGLYDLTLTYTRVADGLQIDWLTQSVSVDGRANGVYEHSGSVVDETPASPTWTYNQLGLQLLDNSFTGSIVADEIAITFTDGGLPGDFNADGVVDAADYTVWRDGLGSEYAASDYDVWRDNYGATSGALAVGVSVPEPTAFWLVVGATAWRWRRR